MDNSTQESSGLTDEAIATWFAGPGGLIDIHSEGTPLLASSVTDQWVNVGLDATLGLYRSLELIASTDQQAPIPDGMRLAILDALANASTDESQPVDSVTASQLSDLTYPGVVVLVAGSIAMAKRKNPRSILRPARVSGLFQEDR